MVNSADTGPCLDFSCLYKGRRHCLKSNSSVCLAYNRPEYASAFLTPRIVSADGLYKQEIRKLAIAASQTAIAAHRGRQRSEPSRVQRAASSSQCEIRPSLPKENQRVFLLSFED